MEHCIKVGKRCAVGIECEQVTATNTSITTTATTTAAAIAATTTVAAAAAAAAVKDKFRLCDAADTSQRQQNSNSLR